MKKLLFILLLTPLFMSAQVADTVGIFLKSGNVTQQIFAIKSYKNKFNTLGSALTYGIASTKLKVEFKNRYSDNVANYIPEVYFYYPTVNMKNATLYAISNPFLPLGGNPNDFYLVKLNPHGDYRELSYGKVNIYSGTTMGIEADKTKTKMTQVRDGVFKISFPDGIDAGEYALVYTSASGAGAYLPVFDFGLWPKNYTDRDKDKVFKEYRREQQESNSQDYWKYTKDKL